MGPGAVNQKWTATLGAAKSNAGRPLFWTRWPGRGGAGSGAAKEITWEGLRSRPPALEMKAPGRGLGRLDR